MAGERFFCTDEAEDVAGSIRHALRCAAFVREDPHAWKWGILTLHSALQGACVCHLTTTAAPIGAVTKCNAKEWIKYFDESRVSRTVKCPVTKLMSLPDLLRAVRKNGSAGGPTTNKLVEIREAELVKLTNIHDKIRNQFVHFEPLVLVIEVSEVSWFGSISARIIKDILDCGWAFRCINQTKKDAMVVDLKRLAEETWSA